MTRQSRTVFAQLALVIGLVLSGAIALAVLLGRELAVRPATAQLLRTVDALADTMESSGGTVGAARTARILRQSGLEVRDREPDVATDGFHPMRAIVERRARAILGDDRPLVAGQGIDGDVLWLRLDTYPTLWVAFAYEDARAGVRRYSIAMLAGCVLLVWLAAAYFARRLTQPLRQLAIAAPSLVRGESVEIDASGAPRELRDLQASLLQACSDVRDAAAERSLMLAGISHDLRTPLTRLQYALALVPDVEPALQDGMERDIAEIDAILSQFIAYARDGRDEPSEPVDLASICRNVAAAVGGDWQLDLPDTAPMRGKPIALQRAVENLAGNARRHGAAPFSLSLAPEGDGWRLEIADCGPGMPAGVVSRATRPFVRGDGGGSGLGLAIVERVARQHGGRLELTHNPPTGLRSAVILRGDTHSAQERTP